VTAVKITRRFRELRDVEFGVPFDGDVAVYDSVLDELVMRPASGPTGPQGPTGATGSAGPEGIQGVPGPTGPQGAAGTGITMKGTVAAPAALPGTGNTHGDAYIVEADDSLWIWDSTAWVSGGPIQGPPGAPGIQGEQGPTGATGPAGPAGASSSIFRFRAKTNSTTGDPGPGHLLWNNTTQTSATQMSIDILDDNNLDVSIGLAALEPGNKIYLQDQSNAANWQDWTVISTAVSAGGYYTVGVALTASGGTGTTNFTPLNVALAMRVTRPGPSRLPSSTVLPASPQLGDLFLHLPAAAAVMWNGSGWVRFTTTPYTP
jgi:hypothetical protein